MAARHVERGRITCRDSTSWKDAYCSGRCPWQKHRGTFAKVYDTPPVVLLSVTWVNKPKTGALDYFFVALEKVDERGFSMRCEVSEGDTLLGAYVDWISVPA